MTLQTDENGFLLPGNENLEEALIDHRVGSSIVRSYETTTRLVVLECADCGDQRQVHIQNLYASSLIGKEDVQLRCHRCYAQAKRVPRVVRECKWCTRKFTVTSGSKRTECKACERRAERNGRCRKCGIGIYKHLVNCPGCSK